jgi:ribosome-binding protein aMBF1 (putative translation factor)
MEGPSQRIDDPAKAREMADAANHARTRLAEEKKLNNGKEFSQFKNLENEAQYGEDVAKAVYEAKAKAGNMGSRELAQERAKAAAVLQALQEEEQSRPH